ncbi:hypothetical protein CWI39_0717p0010 [Hamiltosporidium magnivora]|uniref:Ribosomal RNA large subunit methyltransferase K/L-like methyltransferase domain-containing protein n=1 Tax=Hamiltosporidium magnivora TaxID=148818 RepID=A0A4Q9LBB4_9MICR|nr:hypothetical protein CWI36_1116p0020 [Hamiltosporidium magnivora]TBU05109.1 hypothetical protein CWI39_0717p0010 [Hamiltosporidium magnivora]
MIKKFLIVHLYEHIEFSLNELLQILSMSSEPYKLIDLCNSNSPFSVVETTIKAIDFVCERCILIKSVSLFLDKNENFDNLNEPAILKTSNFTEIFELNNKKTNLNTSLETARISIKSYKFSLKKEQKNSFIEKLVCFLNPRKIDLDKPNLILELHLTKNIFYLSIKYKDSKRKHFLKYNIPNRLFIGHTTMDNELSIVTANLCHINSKSLVYDPCCGSCGILFSATLFKATVFGSDISYCEMVGTNTLKNNVRTLLKPYNVFSNFKQFNLQQYFLGVFIADIYSVRLNNFDCVVADIPYGIRANAKNSYKNTKSNVNRDLKTENSETFGFIDQIKEISLQLQSGKRTALWVPEWVEKYTEECFNRFKLITRCKQLLNSYSRILFVYEKV